MLQRIRKSLEEREEGFTLIELLVVIIIIGILAAIAIPVFLNQRERAWRGAVQSDLRNVAIQAETFLTDSGSYDGFEASTLYTGYRPSSGVTLGVSAADTTVQDYCVEGHHVNNADEVWSYQPSQAPQLKEEACPGASPVLVVGS